MLIRGPSQRFIASIQPVGPVQFQAQRIWFAGFYILRGHHTANRHCSSPTVDEGSGTEPGSDPDFPN